MYFSGKTKKTRIPQVMYPGALILKSVAIPAIIPAKNTSLFSLLFIPLKRNTQIKLIKNGTTEQKSKFIKTQKKLIIKL